MSKGSGRAMLIPAFTCPDCGRISHNPHDVAQRYCGHCHIFFDDQPLQPVANDPAPQAWTLKPTGSDG